MTSEKAPGPYRGAPSATTAPSLVVRYVCITSWAGSVALLVLVPAFGWVIAGEALAQALRTTAGFVVVLVLLAFVRFPVLTIRARVEGGHLIVSGRCWPGPETLWSCTVAEAARFEEQCLRETPGKGREYRRAALRTRDDQVLALTDQAYPGTRWPLPRVVARLNDWLAAQKANG